MADGGTTRQYRLESILGFPGQTEARDAEFQVKSFTINDELNVGYRVMARVKIPNKEFVPPYDATAPYRVQDGQLTMRRVYPTDPKELVNVVLGVIHSTRRVTIPAPLPLDEYEVELVPAFSLLEDHFKGQVWHNKSYKDVLLEVLAEGLGVYGRTFDDRTGDYPVKDFIVRRPDEPLSDFVKKLCRRTGINFFFIHEGAMETMVLADDNGGFEEGNQRYPGEPFEMVWSDAERTMREERLNRYHRSHSAQTGKTIVKAFDFKMPPVLAEGEGEVDGGHGAENIVWHRGRMNELEDAAEQLKFDANLDCEVQTNNIYSVNLETEISGFLAGRRYPLTLHEGDQRDYIVTKVAASGTNLAFDQGSDYSNMAVAVPTTSDGGGAINIRATRPAPASNNHVLYRATVVALKDNPVDVDDYGRMRIKFDWDTNDEDPETYFSVVQPVGGIWGGMQWLPREGDRVLVAFKGTDAEVPMIVGSVFDYEHKPPPMGPPPNQNPGRDVIRPQLVLPDSRHWLGWNQYSIDDKARQSMIQMLTTAGDELVFINAPFDYRLDVLNNSDVKVWVDSFHWVVNEYKEKIGFDGGAGNYDQKIENERTEEVGGNYDLKVTKKRTATLSETDDLTVAKKRTVKVDDEGQFFEIQKKFDKKVYGDDVTNCFGGSFLVGANAAILLRAPDITITESAGTVVGGGLGAAPGGLSFKNKARIHHERQVQIESGPSHIDATPERMDVTAPAVNVSDKAGGSANLANGAYKVEAPQGVTFKCGVNELRLTPEGVYINGQQLVMNARRTDLYTSSFNIVHPDSDPDTDDRSDD